MGGSTRARVRAGVECCAHVRTQRRWQTAFEALPRNRVGVAAARCLMRMAHAFMDEIRTSRGCASDAPSPSCRYNVCTVASAEKRASVALVSVTALQNTSLVSELG